MPEQKTSNQTNSPKPPNQGMLIVLLVIVIVVFVCVFIILNQLNPTNAAQPELTVGTAPGYTDLKVSVSIIKTVCLDTENIDYSLIELLIDGGTPPYDLTVTGANRELSGPYLIPDNNFPVRIKVYGGDSFTASVRSKIGEFWSGTIGLPFEADFCKTAPQPIPESPDTESVPTTPVPADTEANTATLIPSDTQTVVVSVTSTPITPSPTVPAGENTRTARPEKTITLPPHKTGTSSNQPTKTPDPTHPQATGTPRPTDTSRPQTTDTPRPTDTSRPQPTDTPRPTNTSAPPPTVIVPNPKECEDGIDNDGDELIDMADPQCTRPGDPHEDR